MRAESLELAFWLGSHALVFFALATATAFAALAGLWAVLVHQRPALTHAIQGFWSICGRILQQRLHPRWTRFTWITSYLTAYIVVAFLAAAAGLSLFAEIADETQAGEAIALFDQSFTEGVRASSSLFALKAFGLITHAGDPAILVLLSTIVALWLLYRRQRFLMLVWIAATGGNGLLTRLLKAVFERTRPIHDHGVVSYEGWSFPSGHASGSFAVYAMLLYVLLRGRDPQRWHLYGLLAATALILLVGFSRVYLQVHYLSDVVAGFIVAATWLSACVIVAEVARVRTQQRPLIGESNG